MDRPAGTDPVFVKEMGLGHDEFFRILPRALGRDDYSVSGNLVRLGDETRYLDVVLSAEGRRRIASITLPVTRVCLTFHGYSDAEVARALERFDLHFRRGGG